MGLETFALINSLGQVVNHVVIDKEADNFETVIADQLVVWDCVRYVETSEDTPLIILDESPEIWTTHCADAACENQGFNPPSEDLLKLHYGITETNVVDHAVVKIGGRTYPADSMLIKENAANRPAGWTLPEGETEVSMADKD